MRRLPTLVDVELSSAHGGLDALAPAGRRLMEFLDEHYVVARAEAVLKADPRRFAESTRTNTRARSASGSPGHCPSLAT
jgi:hypothetical protein